MDRPKFDLFFRFDNHARAARQKLSESEFVSFSNSREMEYGKPSATTFIKTKWPKECFGQPRIYSIGGEPWVPKIFCSKSNQVRWQRTTFTLWIPHKIFPQTSTLVTRRRRCLVRITHGSVQQMYEKRVMTRRSSSSRRLSRIPRRVVISSRWVPTLNPSQFSWCSCGGGQKTSFRGHIF